ncbi:MAG: Type 4 prepilin-like protein leader peptide-processing enzyme [candidate division TM6 bacterium GW2011_GWE2_41_16]|nr:MAG: Type 4 prepilin-like protein leader peptide-processing enzyme [candidate division TM6 bacterium GW2011_GWE2_41_16]
MNAAVVAVAFISACWGSFLNCLAYRLLEGTSVLKGRSRCPECKTEIKPYDLIPILSWIMLRGRCRSCKKSISWIYPVVELLAAIMGIFLWCTTPSNFSFAAYASLASLLLIHFHTDARDMVLLRPITLATIIIAFATASMNWLPISIISSFLGALLGFGILWSVRMFYLKVRNCEALGDGDPELLASIGAIVGPFGCMGILFISSLFASAFGITYALIKSKKNLLKLKFAYGPFLVLSTFIWIIWQKTLMHFLYHLPQF